ncbi:MBL fold metallo-hydrolase [Dactylosporangium sp. NPDC051541]|uniref:MBL fold metallo-hydrolase n=1 Tax=Dactylosporangium sp. NPDC051541 TaxID=3363977 RepID=UPI0037AF6AF4
MPDLLTPGHPFRQWRTWTMPGSGLTLTGLSRANDKTFFHVPQLKLALDAGLVEGRQPETVLLTHTHLDHAKDLDYLAIRPGGAEISVPAESEQYVRAYLRATTELNQSAQYDPALAADTTIRGVRPGDEFRFGKRGTHSARVIGARHKIPCVGYIIREHRRELVPELAAHPKDQTFAALVKARRAAGAPVDREVTHPLFAYVGDTHTSALEDATWLDEVPVVITECTFLHDEESPRADRVGHTVWPRLRPVIKAHPNTVFVLIHFSLRHSDEEITTHFEADPLPNVVPWAGRDSLLPQQHGM